MTNRLDESTFFVGCDIRRLEYHSGQTDPYIGPVENWPAHITLIPPITERLDESPEDVFRAFRAVGARTSPMMVRAIRDAHFGENGEVLVTVVEDLMVLHFAMLGMLHAYGYDKRYPEQFTGRHFNAHTSRNTGSLPPAAAITLDSMSVFRRKNGQKYIQERILFGR